MGKFWWLGVMNVESREWVDMAGAECGLLGWVVVDEGGGCVV